MSLIGSNNEEKIWNYLISIYQNPYGVAGLMGNLYAESALNPKNLQNTFEKKLGYTDDTYTTAVDSGKYSREKFGKDSAGYGLAQWTYYSRKYNLYDFVKSLGTSIGDLESQLKFLVRELEGYKGIPAQLKSAKSVLEASNVILLNFERPKDQSTAVQNTRASYGQKYYDKYASAKSNSSTPTPNSSSTLAPWKGGSMTDNEFISRLQKVVDNFSTLYVMGCFGAPLTGSNVNRYCTNHKYNMQAARTNMIKAAANKNPPVFGFDCVNLIKGILWGWVGDPSKSYGGAQYQTNGVPDIGADQMIRVCKDVSTNFSNIVPGEAVWMSGHIGVYIGDGKVIECTPSFKNNVQVTNCRNVKTIAGMNGRTWTKHGKLPYITYTGKANPAPTPAGKSTYGQYKVTTKSSALNCRSGPSTDYGVVGQFNPGELLTASKEENGWLYVSNGKVQGWSSKQYLSIVDAKAAISTLVAKGIINSPDYWNDHYKDIGSLDRLLMIMADATTSYPLSSSKVATAEAALDLMAQKGLINSPDYWKTSYKQVKYLDTLLIKFASSL